MSWGLLRSGSTLAAMLFAAVSASPAHSAYVQDVTATVDFWNYDAGTTFSSLTQASPSNPVLSSAPTFEFTYSGALNWSTTLTTNTIGQFLGPTGIGSITSYAGTPTDLANFLNTQMSVPGDTTTSMFRLTGTTSTVSSVSGPTYFGQLTHDDGATLIVNGQTVVNAPDETYVDTNVFSTPSGSNSTPFTLYYVEGNGAPADLILQAVPEPASWAMMILGFFGLGVMAYRRNGRVSFRAI